MRCLTGSCCSAAIRAADQQVIRRYRKADFRAVGVMRQYERGADGRIHDGLLMDQTRDDPLP